LVAKEKGCRRTCVRICAWIRKGRCGIRGEAVEFLRRVDGGLFPPVQQRLALRQVDQRLN